jgi:transforming growth factor-beta-induced protein
VKEMKVIRVLFGLFCILSLIHAVRIEAQTLSEVEREHPDISTLITLVNSTLSTQLSALAAANRTITVFAPDNTAFESLPANVTARLHTNETLLRDVLLYHIVPGNLSAHFLLGEGVILVKTLFDNETLMLNATRTTIYVEGTRKVIVPDVFFDLGVIHIINGVLIPPSLHGAVLYGTS